MATEAPGEAVIELDSDDDAEKAAAEDAEGAKAAAALAATRPSESIVCQLVLPPSRGLTTPQQAGDVEIFYDKEDPALRIVPPPLEDEEAPTEEEDLCLPLRAITSVDVKAEGRSVIISLSPPVAPTGFSVPFMAEGHKLSMVCLVPAPKDVRAVLATLIAWLPQLTVFGPRSLGLAQRPAEEPLTLRFQGTALDERDMVLLDDDQWVNDNVLDFFMRLAVDVACPAELQDQLYVAKTQFFTRLTACGASSGEKGWENVKTWTRSVSGGVAAQRFLVYPVNEANLHWCMFFVCHPQRAMELGRGGSKSLAEADIPRMVCLDSAWEPLPKDEHVKLLKGYLRRELFQQPSGNSIGDVAKASPEQMIALVQTWKQAVTGLEKMEAIDAEVPKQQNVYDCGLFVLEFLLFLLRRPAEFSSLGLESHLEWFDQYTISHRRIEMRELLSRLQREARSSGQADIAVLLKDGNLRSAACKALTSEPPPRPKEETPPAADEDPGPPQEGEPWLPPQPKSRPEQRPASAGAPPWGPASQAWPQADTAAAWSSAVPGAWSQAAWSQAPEAAWSSAWGQANGSFDEQAAKRARLEGGQ
eukprot:TRINITY_DN78374_c0_g1_i1.p1 TRINITY_DN78374_c0_g1~~TRINITY_DN78374_c0_g1_i1.p1  ORF type:complete len:595 (-),score=141.76 TRINITY_DN78374_c0_g1_i1:73-1833(-)